MAISEVMKTPLWFARELSTVMSEVMRDQEAKYIEIAKDGKNCKIDDKRDDKDVAYAKNEEVCNFDNIGYDRDFDYAEDVVDVCQGDNNSDARGGEDVNDVC